MLEYCELDAQLSGWCVFTADEDARQPMFTALLARADWYVL